jgi:hypothetical protein
MTTEREQAQKKIDNYLSSLRSRLRGLSSETSREIIEELRSHIADKATADGELIPQRVDAALAALGSPAELARQYTTDDLLIRAEVSRSPLRIMDSLFRWASFSSIGFLVLMGSVFGYFVGFALIVCATLKPFHPYAAGLWLLPDGEFSLRMGFGMVPPAGRDVLGWWIVPVGLEAGCGLLTFTTRFALWCARECLTSRLPRQQS